MAVKSDENIKRDVVEQLYWDDRVDASDINVEVSNGTVTLRGTVPNHTAQRAALADAWVVSGVSSVNNKLSVTYPTGITVPEDEAIRSDIETVVRLSSSMHGSNMNISVKGGTVTLEGSVDSYWKKVKAEDLASDVTGVVQVINNLTVVPTRDIEDKDIAEDIVKAIDRNALIDADTINIKVEKGLVTLSGAVNSWSAHRAAEYTAWHTPGVIDVINAITIT